MEIQHAPRDPMQDVDEHDPETVERFVERLERRASDPAFAGYRVAYLERLDLPRPAAVLDLGCGTAVVGRALAARDGIAVTAVDQSEALLAAGERLAAAEGVSGRIELVLGDAHELDFAAASFDAVVAHTLLSHVRDPAAVLAEAARVVRPGGTVAVFDGDYASLAFGCADARLGRAVEAALQSLIAGPRVMRDLPRLLPAAGLTRRATHAHAYAEAGEGGFLLGLAETWGPLVAAAGLVPAAGIDAWLADLRASAGGGMFFAACTYYAVLARC